MAEILRAHGGREPLVTVGPEASLAELNGAVDGYIEVVGPLPDGRLMVIDEEGKLKGKSYNGNATELARSRLRRGDVIVGDAVVGTPKELGLYQAPVLADEVVLLDLSGESLVKLGLPDHATRTELYGIITALRHRDDADFPRGKWATIQALEQILVTR